MFQVSWEMADTYKPHIANKTNELGLNSKLALAEKNWLGKCLPLNPETFPPTSTSPNCRPASGKAPRAIIGASVAN
jgi:hypothetical protein